MSGVTNTRDLQSYAAELHICSSKLEGLSWNNLKDQEKIVKYLKKFVDRTASPGQDKTIEMVMKQISTKVLSECNQDDFEALESIRKDSETLQRHFSKIGVLQKMSKNESIFSIFLRCFGFGSKTPQFDNQNAMNAFNVGYNNLRTNLAEQIKAQSTSHFVQRNEQMLDFLLRYDTSTAMDFKARFDALRNKTGDNTKEMKALYDEIYKEIDDHKVDILRHFKANLDKPPFLAFYQHLTADLAFLKQFMHNDSLLKKGEFARAVIAKLAPAHRQNVSIQQRAPVALQTLEHIEKHIQATMKRKDVQTQLLLEKLTEFVQEMKGLNLKNTNNIEALIKKVKASPNPEQHFLELRFAHAEAKASFLKILKSRIATYKKEIVNGDVDGVPMINRWVSRLISNPDFVNDANRFTKQFGEEKDQFKQIRMFYDFLQDILQKYNPSIKGELGGEETSKFIDAILVVSPTDDFLRQFLDMDTTVIGMYSSDYHPKIKFDQSHFAFCHAQVTTSMKFIIKPPRTWEEKNVEIRLERIDSLLQKFTPSEELLKAQKALAKKKNTISKFDSELKKYEATARHEFEQAFVTARNKHLDPTYQFTKKDIRIINQMIYERDDIKQLALFQQLNPDPTFLQQLLCRCDPKVAFAIQNIDKDYISSKFPGETKEEVEASIQTYKQLTSALNSILKQ